MNLQLYGNFLDGNATNSLIPDVDWAIRWSSTSASDMINLDITNTSIAGNNHIMTYGARARTNDFDLSIAPGGDTRDEWGVFFQDEILLGDKLRWVIGARYDDIDPLEDGIVSPRTTFLYSPTPNSTFRASYNEAFRSPSMVNNYLDIVIINPVCLAPLRTAAAPAVLSFPVWPAATSS